MKKPVSSEFIAYYRVSTDKQGESGLGLEAQRSAVGRFVQGKGNLIAEFTEVESGKSHLNRPQLKRAVEACKKHRAKLVIAKLDRLARNVHFISGLMESAVEFCAVDMPQANRLTVHIMAAIAEHEREMISARTVAGLAEVKRELAENGFRISRKSGRRFTQLGNPRWQESIEKATAARRNPVKASPEVIQMMQDLRKQGKTLRAIAEQLNGLELKTRAGCKWYASTVLFALKATAKVAPIAELPAA